MTSQSVHCLHYCAACVKHAEDECKLEQVQAGLVVPSHACLLSSLVFNLSCCLPKACTHGVGPAPCLCSKIEGLAFTRQLDTQQHGPL